MYADGTILISDNIKNVQGMFHEFITFIEKKIEYGIKF